jgi:CheY-like chemotaxis protein
VETAREIRAVVGDEIPIIILSAYDWSDIEQEATLAGVNAFIEKPLFRTKLTHVLTEILGVPHNKEKSSDLDTYVQKDYSGRRVLLVEDNELNVEVAKELLEMVGLKVESVHNGQEALELVAQSEEGYFDLIFMDIQMPIMNGYESAAAIRSLGREDLKQIPIIAMTADAFAEDVKKALEAGMNGHIAKPIDIPHLEAVMAEWMK